MPTIEQIRAARALIGWSQGDLADQADLSQTGIARIENGTNKPNSQTLAKIMTAFDKADVEFISDSGVKKRTGEVRTLRGKSGFADFMDDVYETVKNYGGEICVSNVDERHWDKYIVASNSDYLEKMNALCAKREFNSKILIKQGDDFTLASGYATYRSSPAESFGSVPFYVYGDKIAIILFDEDSVDIDVTVYIIHNKEIANAQRKQFNIVWDAAE